MTKKIKLFTLIELSIVIGIIVILGLSAFLIVTKWIGKSKNARVMSDVSTVARGLDYYVLEGNGKYPEPSNFVEVGVIKQGEFGTGQSKEIDIDKFVKQPDSSPYIYSTAFNEKQYIVAGWLDMSESALLNNKTYGYKKKLFKKGNIDIPIVFNTGLNILEGVNDYNTGDIIAIKDNGEILSGENIEDDIEEYLRTKQYIAFGIVEIGGDNSNTNYENNEELEEDYSFSATDTFLDHDDCTVSGSTEIFEGGDGTELNPYLIKYDYQLDGVRCDLSANYKLLNSISLENYQSGFGFKSIGGDGYEFEGKFDGNGKNISSVTVNGNGFDFVGLFGGLGATGEIKNLSVQVNSITGDAYVGGLVGYTEGTIDNVYVVIHGTIYASETISYLGGFAGYMYDGSITNSSITANGLISGGGNYVGGMIGLIDYGTFSNNSIIINNDIEGGGYIGGLVGGNYSDITNSTIDINGDITGTEQVGGVIGVSYGNVTNVSLNYLGNINGTSNRVGGLVGRLSNAYGNNPKISSSELYLNGTISGDKDVGGLVGASYSIIDNITLKVINGNISSSNGYIGGLVGGNYSDITNSTVEFNGEISSTGNHVGGLLGVLYDSGKLENIYNVHNGNILSTSSNVGGLVGLAYGNIENVNSTINGDIKGPSGVVGGLVGRQNIDGYIPYISGSSLNYKGTIDGKKWLGGLVGYAKGSIDNVTMNGEININGESKLGGLVGEAQGNIDGVNMNGKVNISSTSDFVGGVIGYTVGDILRSVIKINGNLSGSGEDIGGFVGATEGNITDIDFEFEGEIIGSSKIGGFLGRLIQSSGNVISNSELNFNGTIKGSSYIGGFVGRTFGDIRNVYLNYTGEIDGSTGIGDRIGGFAGNVSNVSISEVYIDGTVNIYGNSLIGGFAGVSFGDIEDSYSKIIGNISGSGEDIGGFVGQLSNYYGNPQILNCYSVQDGNITGNSDVGGFIGSNYGTISNSYYDDINNSNDYMGYNNGTITGNWGGSSRSGPEDGKKDISSSSFIGNSGWDSSIWGYDGGINDGYLYLKSLADTY